MRTLFQGFLATALLLAGVSQARATASLVAASTAATIGATSASRLTPSAGLGAFVSRWDTKDRGVLTGYGVRLGWKLVSHLGLEARASYLESEEDALSTTLVPIEAALTWRIPMGQVLTPYVGAGLGYYMEDVTYTDTTTWDSSDKSVGYFALAGASVRLGPVSLFADAKYSLISTGDTLEWRGEDVEAKNSLDGLSLTAGLKLGF